MIQFTRIKFKYQDLGVMIRSNSDALINVIINFITICHCMVTSSFIKNIRTTMLKLQHIQKTQGNRGLVTYLKTATVALQQATSGYILDDIASISKVRIARKKSSGIPKLIPANHRRIIDSNSVYKYPLIKFWLSIFYMYRIIYHSGEGSLKSIEAPNNKGYMDQLPWRHYLGIFLSNLPNKVYLKGIDWLKTFNKPVRSIFAASPNRARGDSYQNEDYALHSTHPSSIVNSRLALNRNPSTLTKLQKVCVMLDRNDILSLLSHGHIEEKNLLVPGKSTHIGQLSVKPEAAGKMRIFAYVDCYTNWCLQSLHDCIFKGILSKLPMDGTFNQIRPAKRLLKRKTNGLYSVDLSSATDRLPLELQELILSDLFNNEFASYWKDIMVDRDFNLVVPFIFRTKNFFSRKDVRYTVGQPMGALSSWAMLALTHHFIVQVAAWKAGENPFKLYKNYALLGDDLVLGDYSVYFHYCKIMKLLQVNISLAKSILSSASLGIEFAKKTLLVNSKQIFDVSPISFRDYSTSLNSFAEFVSFCNNNNLKLSDRLKISGYGYRVLSSINKEFSKCNLIVKNHILSNFSKFNFSDNIQVTLTKTFHRGLKYSTLILALKELILDSFERLDSKIGMLRHLIKILIKDRVTIQIKDPSGTKSVLLPSKVFQILYLRSIYLIYRSSYNPTAGPEKLFELFSYKEFIPSSSLPDFVAKTISAIFNKTGLRLLPHLTVKENIKIGLKNKHLWSSSVQYMKNINAFASVFDYDILLKYINPKTWNRLYQLFVAVAGREMQALYSELVSEYNRLSKLYHSTDDLKTLFEIYFKLSELSVKTSPNNLLFDYKVNISRRLPWRLSVYNSWLRLHTKLLKRLTIKPKDTIQNIPFLMLFDIRDPIIWGFYLFIIVYLLYLSYGSIFDPRFYQTYPLFSKNLIFLLGVFSGFGIFLGGYVSYDVPTNLIFNQLVNPVLIQELLLARSN